jgi:ferredoxin
MKIEVDRVKCVGLGLCEAASPDHFEVGDDGQLVLLSDTVTDEQRAEAEEAVRSCPTAALRLLA